MTDSSQQEFFLEHFQKVRDLIEGGEVRKALGVMLDVRENGFVNKELDTMIDSLRGDPPAEVVAEALRWSTMIVERLKSFGGDVFQLVEEFSEASLGLSEAEWVPVDGGAEGADLTGESDGLLSMDFDGIDDMDFELDIEDIGSQELDVDLDFSHDDEEWGALDNLEELSDLDDLDDLEDLSEFSELIESPEEEAEEAEEEGSPDSTEATADYGIELDPSGELDPSSIDFALVEGSAPHEGSDLNVESHGDEPPPARLDREDQQTRPNPSVMDPDRETKPHQAVSRDEQSGETSLRETAKQPAAQPDNPPEDHSPQEEPPEQQQATGEESIEESAEDKFAGFNFDDSEPIDQGSNDQDDSHHGFVDEATRRSDPLKEVLAARAMSGASKKAKSPDPEPSEPKEDAPSDPKSTAEEEDFDFDLGFENPASRVETPASPPAPSDEGGADEDDFDFDLGFENPTSRVETPGSVPSGPGEPEVDEEAEAGDDFDFNLGFENPESRTQTPTGTPFVTPEPVEEQDDEEEDEFDFDLGFENPASKASGPGRLAGGAPSEAEHDIDFEVGSLEGDGGSDETKDSGSGEARDPEATPASMPSIPRFRAPNEEEETSPKDEPTADDSLDDDEFFELAESLSSESSDASLQQGPYRGEPLMNSSDTPMPTSTPTPAPPPPEEDLSEVSQGRERADTPNPFAHEAPTGVQKALVDSHSSFVLEEIRDSEASEAQDDEAAVGALVGEARRLYEKGKFESAHDLLEAVLERDEVNDEVQELMGTVEGELERQHQAQLGSLSKVPQLKVAMSDIPKMNLDHRFGYLLSQIDGMSTYEDILELSSMTRLETLEVLAQMIDRDIINVD